MARRRLSEREQKRAIKREVRAEVEMECGRDEWKGLRKMIESVVTENRWFAEKVHDGTANDDDHAKVHSDTATALEHLVPMLDRQYNAPSTVRHGRQEYQFPAAFNGSKAKRVWYNANRVQMDRLLLLRRLMDWAARREKVVQRDGRYYGVIVARSRDLAQWWGCTEPTARQTMIDLCRGGYAHRRGIIYDGQARVGTAYMIGRRHAGVGMARPAWTWLEPADKVVPDAAGGETHELAPAVPDWASIDLYPDQFYRFSYNDAMSAVSATME